MISQVLQLSVGQAVPEAGFVADDRAPDAVLAFLPSDGLPTRLAEIAGRWPRAIRFGCEAVTQFGRGALARGGTLHLLWFREPASRPEVMLLEARDKGFPTAKAVEQLAERLEGCSAAFIICDGLRFPAEALLHELRMRVGPKLPPIAGGLASQTEPVDRPGARVFSGESIASSGCLVVMFRGVEMKVEVVRGWKAASPVYTVTAADGNVVRTIDGKPATDWYRHFFQTEDGMAPMPESAYRFPLVVEGPKPERQGLYRSMRFFDSPPGAVTFWGDLEEGDEVRLGMGNGGSLVQTAAALRASLHPEAAVLYSCVGRELVLGEAAAEEVATIDRVLDHVPLSGFFTFGEIGPSAGGGLAFYNQTAILALLREEPA